MGKKYVDIKKCWCGSDKLERFSDHFVKCTECMTLINSPRLEDSFFAVIDDEKDLYGKRYWIEYQTKEFGNPDIFARVRNDLSERCAYWLSKILKYKLPPAKTLELGCGHGGLVAMMKMVGFDAMGAELSEWVIEFAQQSFDINVLKGKIEDLNFEPGSVDAIILMDVFEHFIDPSKTMEIISKVLRNDGILVIQTPCYSDTDLLYRDMVKHGNLFVKQMKAQEHLYLFSTSGIQKLLNRFGFMNIHFEPALFPYDMFLIGSRLPLECNSEDDISNYLVETQSGRFLQAMLDIYEQCQKLRCQLEESEFDRSARLEIINSLEDRLKESESDRIARLDIINSLEDRLKESESDRTARLDIINSLEDRLKESESDRAARLEVIHKANNRLKELESERLAKAKLINDLNEKLKKYEVDGISTFKGKLIEFINKL